MFHGQEALKHTRGLSEPVTQVHACKTYQEGFSWHSENSKQSLSKHQERTQNHVSSSGAYNKLESDWRKLTHILVGIPKEPDTGS